MQGQESADATDDLAWTVLVPGSCLRFALDILIGLTAFVSSNASQPCGPSMSTHTNSVVVTLTNKKKSKLKEQAVGGWLELIPFLPELIPFYLLSERN